MGSGEGSAGRAVHASLVPRKPTLPACAVGDPRFCTPFALDLSPFRLRPTSFDPARAVAAGYMLRNRHGGNRRQPSATIDHTTSLFVRHSREMERKSGSRRNCREIVGHCCLLVVVRFFFGTRQAFAARKNDTRHRRCRRRNAYAFDTAATYGNRPTTPDFLRHCLCGTAA